MSNVLEKMNMSLAEMAQRMEADLVGSDEVMVSSVSTDTRSLDPGSLFVALKGPHYDGHRFLDVAEEKGAAAAMVESVQEGALPQLVVGDTRLALGELAANWRDGFDIPLMAITGSNGKTSVKEMLAAIWSQQGAVLATHGNLNNDIGMPLTLLQLRKGHLAAVIEMGANHKGEIAYLTALAKPTVALVNNAGMAHLEGFGSLQGVAEAKGEIYQGLSRDGVAVINADDHYADYWRGLNKGRELISFGLEQKADVTAQWRSTANGSHIDISTPKGELSVELALLGRHNVMNALAATSVALAAGASLQQIARGLDTVKAVKGRLQVSSAVQGATLINDTYNANPTSLAVALDVLADFDGERILVLGDMGELGEAAAELHADIGRRCAEQGLDGLYACGALASEAVSTFGDKGQVFENKQALIEALQKQLKSTTVLLVKGSRSAAMEEVVDALQVEREGGV